MSDIKPCPFCGGRAKAHAIENPDDPNCGGRFIECSGCGASTNLRFACGDDPMPLLREQWNRRATTSSSEASPPCAS